ncbi:hypothetical protein Q7C36_017082 [Tachysurus vachellii]|uniref:Ig-like domain-containing protein n=1 Tax=Tachysurus vachellii TaxID=175792 RepID=A0AA88M246_TACVA|nr:hypothetical protein Q7C36_017082 [Tachysurus vachellii]
MYMQFSCCYLTVYRGFSPKKIDVKWNKDNNPFRVQPTLEIFENFQGRPKVFAALSKVSINANEWSTGTEFTCTATQKTKTYSESWNNCKAKPTSTPRIRLEKPRLVSILTGTPVTASCFVETELIPKVLWFVDDKEITEKIITDKQQERTISNLTISPEKWKTAKTITCKASHSCFNSTEKISFSEPKKSPTVVIRRNLEDIQKGDTEVLECTATDLPSGELLVTFQANGAKVSEDQYVILPEGLDSLTRRFTVPTTNQKKDNSFSCQIQSLSGSWKSNSTGNIFGDPSVDLSAVTSVDIKGSPTQKLLCSGTGLNPTITWTKILTIAHSMRTMEADGRVKVISEVMVPQQDWTKGETFTCQFRDQNNLKEKSISICSEPKKSPTVVIRRNLEDIQKGDTEVLECTATDLPSGELLVTFQANSAKVSEDQYVILPEGLDSLTRRFTVPTTNQKKDKSFSCQIQSQSGSWKSSSTGNIFGDPSVDLSAVTSVDIKGSPTQKLLCSGTGLNPTITWTKILTIAHSMRTMEADGRVKVISEVMVPQQDWTKGETFTCQFRDQNNLKEKSISICSVNPEFVQMPQVYLLAPSIKDMRESKVSVTCLLLGHYLDVFTISWKVGDRSNSKDATKSPTKVNKNGTESLSSVLKVAITQWNNYATVDCEVKHPCFKEPTKYSISKTREPKKSPTVVIRRNLEDIQKGDTEVLECTATDLPSGELLVTFQANSAKVSEDQYVILPEGLDSLTRRFTVPTTNQKKDKSFSCQIQSQSGSWKSNSTGNIFGDPSVDLSAVTSVDIKGSPAQKLLCSGTGLNPTITWTKILTIAHSMRTMEADGRVKVISEVMVPQQDWTKGETFTCQFRDQHNLKEKSISICSVNPEFVQMPQVYLLAPSIKDMRESKVSVTCLLLGHYLDVFTISWKVGDRSNSKDATKSPTKVNKNGTESLSSVLKVAITQWNNYATVDCEVKHPCAKEPTKYSISKTRDPKSPTIRILSPSEDELSGVHNTSLICFVEGFHPADISVHWELNGIRLEASRFSNSPVSMQSERAAYSMHSRLTLPTSEMENGDFSCVVNHESSETPIKRTINNIYASVMQQAPSVKLLQGQDELVCLVNGYSPSAINITWLRNNDTVIRENNTSSSDKGPDGKFNIRSHLYIQAMEWVPGDKYTCQVEHITGIISRFVSKTEFIEKTIYYDENKAEPAIMDQSEETWNMACAFIILFILSLIYGCSMTLVKVNTK